MWNYINNLKGELLVFDTTGSTVAAVTPYRDMLGIERMSFYVMGRGALPTTANSTMVQKMVVQLLQATDSTGGGATNITSAAATVGKLSTNNVIGATCKARELYIQFTTLASAATFSINGLQWSFDSTAVPTSRIMDSTGATGQASVASEAFKTNFNSTANNTFATAWQCATITSALVKIYPVNPETSAFITATGSTLVNVGMGRTYAHVNIDQTCLKDGYRYVAAQVTQSDTAAPYAVFTIRAYAQGGNVPRVSQQRVIVPESTSR